MNTLHLAKTIAEEANETKALDLKILDLSKLTSFTDYFILATGTSSRHVQSIADRIHLKLKKEQHRLPLSFEGYPSGQWILLDYGDVVLHVFLENQRQYYELDEFWATAPVIDFNSGKPKKSPAKKPKTTKKKKSPKPSPAKKKKKR
jgi:ribosome-associated protein